MHLSRTIIFCLAVVATLSIVCAEKAKTPKKKKTSAFKWVNPNDRWRKSPSIRHERFSSELVKQEVGYFILLPPSYAETPSKRFPVVYYLHGGRPGSEGKAVGLAPMILDAMKSGEVMEMIYVFVNGGPVSHYNVPDKPGAIGADVFIKELIPHIDETYRTIANRRGRGLEGFSQGGRGTMRLSLRYPELFGSAAAGGGGYETERRISESGGYENERLKFAEGDNAWDLARQYANSKQPRVKLMIYVGTKGFNYQNNLQYMTFLEQQGVQFDQLIVAGVPHSAKGIYEKRGRELMKFHAANFK